MGLLQRSNLIGIGGTELLELLVDCCDASANERHKLLQWSPVGVFGVIPGKLLNVSSGGDTTDGEVALLANELGAGLFDLPND